MHKMDVDSVECDPILGKLVEGRLLFAPIVGVSPVGGERLHITEVGTILPTRVNEFVGPACGIESARQIREYGVRHIDSELFDGHFDRLLDVSTCREVTFM